jgi:hypothetical protein
MSNVAHDIVAKLFLKMAEETIQETQLRDDLVSLATPARLEANRFFAGAINLRRVTR